MHHRTWIEISAHAFEENIAHIARISPAPIGIVIKANAYGHGILQIASLCEKNSQIAWLFTAGIQEALAVRHAGIKKPLLAMAYLDDSIENALNQHIDLVVWDRDSAEFIHTVARQLKKTARVHLKIDTGMSRLGFLPHEAIEFMQSTKLLYPWLHFFGCFTHLADTNNIDLAFTREQISRFDHVIAQLAARKIIIPFTHILSSGGTFFKHASQVVRIGTNAYGFWKSAVQKQRYQDLYPDFKLTPILNWKTKIQHIQSVPAGSTVGYNRTYTAPYDMRMGIMPIGYWDGYSRALSNNAQVALIQKETVHLVPVVGIIGMNFAAIDLTRIIDPSYKDTVMLMGNTPGITATDIAQRLQTINNELVTHINADIPRIIV